MNFELCIFFFAAGFATAAVIGTPWILGYSDIRSPVEDEVVLVCYLLT